MSRASASPSPFHWSRFNPAISIAFLLLSPVAPAAANDDTYARMHDMPLALDQAPSVWDGHQYAYTFGGYTSGNTVSGAIIRYEPGTDTALTMPTSLAPPRAGTSAVWDPRSSTACPGGCAYIFGGQDQTGKDLDAIVTYVPSTQTTLTSAAKLPCATQQMSAVFDGQFAYLFGGPDGGCAGGVTLFDPVQNRATFILRDERLNLSGTSAIWDPRDRPAGGCSHGCAYIFGGVFPHDPKVTDGFIDTILRYNPTTNTLTKMQSHLQSKRMWTGAVFDGTYAYVMGGGTDGAIYNNTSWFDPATDTSGEMNGVIPIRQDDFGAIWAGTDAYLFGGFGCDSSGCFISQKIFRYHPPATPPPSQTPPPPNRPPTASFSVSTGGLTASVDASASKDPDGTITSYQWQWGDGATGTGITASHTYAATGGYAIILTVTDNGGATGTTTQTISVSAPAPPPGPPPPSPPSPPPTNDQPPLPAFSIYVSGANVTTDGAASSDPDGWVTDYSWTWGDGTRSTGARGSHTYTTSGTFAITLTVTDNQGTTASKTTTVNVTAPPAPAYRTPIARFSLTQDKLTILVNASMSSTPNGWIATYAWQWGDGTSNPNESATHTYQSAGTYAILLTVTDNQGLTANTSQLVNVTTPRGDPPQNVRQPPVAAFTLAIENLTAHADATPSSDQSGAIISFIWDWGDGNTSTGPTATHTYTGAGDYAIRLDVTDNASATASTAQIARLIAPTPAPTHPPPAPPQGSGTSRTNETNATTPAPVVTPGNPTRQPPTHSFNGSGQGSDRINATDTKPASPTGNDTPSNASVAGATAGTSQTRPTLGPAPVLLLLLIIAVAILCRRRR